MANLPPSSTNDPKLSAAEQLVRDILDPELRENALQELSKKREIFDDLAPMLWHSDAIVSVLLQEIISVYPLLSPPTMNAVQSNRVCNALALYQCVAAHPETRMPFIEAQLPQYMYAFLDTSSKSKPFEFLRLTSLGVIGALVRVDDSEVIKFLLKTGVMPYCLRTMENGCELSKTVATFIVQKILLEDDGLDYMCAAADRFFALCHVLGNMVTSLAEAPSLRLLKHIVRCYLRLTDHPKACLALKRCLPDLLSNATFISCLYDDPAASLWLQQLLHNVTVGGRQPQDLEHMFVKVITKDV